MVGVLEVFGEHDVADVEERGELRNGEVPDAPRVLELVGDAGVENQAPPRVGGLVHRAERLDEEREGAVAGNHFDDALPRPGGELGAKRDLGGLVALPAGVVRASGRAKGKAGLGHAESPFDDRRGHRVERAEALVPLGGGAEDRHEVAGWRLAEADVLRHEARGEVGAPGGVHQTGRGGRGGPGQDGMGGADGDQRLGREEERQGVGVIGLR